MPKNITQKRLKELLRYNPQTGHFFRLKSCGKGVSGSIVGSKIHHGYILICIDYQQYLAHRLAWLYIYGKFPKVHIDHINGNASDNRLCNLREATISQNLANSKQRKDNTSGLKGVSLDKRCGKWVAQISIYGKQIRIGSYVSKEEAYAAYLARARKEFGSFARAE